jgi:hypothetical protein
MIELFIGGYLLASLITFRYLGYSINQDALSGHEFQRICHSCICSECGNDARSHYADKPCRDGEWTGIHFITFGLGVPISLLWPIVVFCWGISTGYKASGLELTFFKPVPEVRSREERRAAKELKTQARLKELEERNAELEHELGIRAD